MARRTKDEADALSINIFKMKLAGKKNKEIAKELGLHPSTVSTKLKEMRAKLKDLDMRVGKGEIVLREKEQTALAIPSENPFYQLNTFNEMAGITNAGGAVFGAAAAAISEGFQNEKIPYEERMMKVMKGASVIGGGLLSLYATFKGLTETPEEQKPTVRIINPGERPVTTTNEPAPSTPTTEQG